jgi:hypothetical protein
MNKVLRIEYFAKQSDFETRKAQLGNPPLAGAFKPADRAEIVEMTLANGQWSEVEKATYSPAADGFLIAVIT